MGSNFGLKWAFFEIDRAPSNLLEILKIFFRFTDIESIVVPGNLFPFFNLKFEYFFELFTILTLACNFNLSAGN